MSFAKYDSKGKVKRNRVVIDCQKAIEDGDEEILVEQNHKASTDINNIIARHGGYEAVEAVAMMQSNMFRFDDVTGNDFSEAMNILVKAREHFDELPVKVRKEFDYNPGKFLDYVQNPDNLDEMIKRGFVTPVEPKPEPEPQKVQVVNPETPAK